MNSKEICEQLSNRKSSVISFGETRNTEYYEYLQASSEYDNLKKAFYIAIKLAKLDQIIPEEQLQRYEHLMIHFDKQLLCQLKKEDFKIQEFDVEDDTENGGFAERIYKIKAQGISRNKMHFKFTASEGELSDATNLLYNKITLASRDGLITEIEEKMYVESIKSIVKSSNEEMQQIRQSYNEKRHYERHHDHTHRAQVQDNKGRGNKGRGNKSRGNNGRGNNVRGNGRGNNGRGSERNRHGNVGEYRDQWPYYRLRG